jgi:hypothetical protein
MPVIWRFHHEFASKQGAAQPTIGFYRRDADHRHSFSLDVMVWMTPFARSSVNSDGQIAFSQKAYQAIILPPFRQIIRTKISVRFHCVIKEGRLQCLLNGMIWAGDQSFMPTHQSGFVFVRMW